MKKHLLLFACLISLFANAQKVTVDYSARKQYINMIGTDMERSAAFIQSAADPLEVCQWCFADIPYKAVRVPYDKKQELTEGQPNLAYYNDIIASMKMARQVNPDIEFYATMKSDYSGYGDENNLPEWICDDRPNTFFHVDKYVSFLADYLQLMNDNGVAITYMTVAKEWLQTVTVTRTIEIIEGLKTELASRGVPEPKFTDPSAWSVQQAKNFVNSVISAGKQDLFYAFSTHNYGNTWENNYDDYVLACENAGKFSWNDESNYGSGGRTNGIEPETIASILDTYSTRAFYYKQGLEGELFFEICSRGVSSETRAVYFTKGSEAKRMRTYYVAKLFEESAAERNYATSSMSGLATDVSTMSFISPTELGLWIVNDTDNDYESLELAFDNVTVSSDVLHYAFSSESKIQGDLTDVIPSSGKYTVHVAPNTINYIEVRLKDQADRVTDVIEIEQESLDFGAVGSGELDEVEKILYVKVDNPSTDVSVSFSGAHASAFSVENAIIKQSPMVWYVPVVVKMVKPQAGTYSAVINVSSGSQSKSVPVSGTIYKADVVSMPFVDEFPSIVAQTPLDNGLLNAYTTYKGWSVDGGQSSATDRIAIVSTGNPDAYVMTPEIEIDGPFELVFKARMIQNEQGDTDAEKDENDLMRNFYAIVEDDTIYDHHKTGSTAFQNFNQWTCTYDYSGTTRVKFMAKVSTDGVWSGLVDGLSIGPGDDAIRVQSTTLPAINIAYGHCIDYGQVLATAKNDVRFNVIGSNLTEDLTLSTTDSKVTMNQDVLSQSAGSINSYVVFRVNTANLSPGKYTSIVTLTGENTQIKTRTITLAYEVVDPSGIEEIQVEDFNILVKNNAVVLQSDKALDHSYYNMAGVCLGSFFRVSESTMQLKQGVYIVRCGNTTKKVVVSF